jgi:drug/metabolite transporter (DMT)-like permease
MPVLLSIASACFYAVAVVAQHRAARTAAPAAALRPQLLLDLARRPAWVAGLAANGIAFVLRFLALGRGSLVLVQTLVMTGVVLALPLGAALDRTRPPRREWAGAIAAVSGLAVFLAVAHPARGATAASGSAWAFAAVVLVAPAIACVAWARSAPPARRAALLAGAAGLLLALAAALIKTTAAKSSIAAAATSWPVFGLIAAGGLGALLVQNSFQAGPLSAAVPVVSVVEPLASVVTGATLFHEHIAAHRGAPAVEAAALAVSFAGILMVTR